MNPFDITPIITNLTYKIESIAYNTEVEQGSDKIRGVVYLGTNDAQVIRYNITEGKQLSKTGRLSLYLLKPPPGEAPRDPIKVTFRKHPVTQLEVVNEHNIVLALCGQELYALDATTLAETKSSTTLKEKDKSTSWKGCVAFAVEKPRKLSRGPAAGTRLCVLCGRGKRIALYNWMRGGYEYDREITLNEQCYSVEWCGSKHVVLTTRKDVFLVDICIGRIITVRLPPDPAAPAATGMIGLGGIAGAALGGGGGTPPAVATVDGTLFVARGAGCYVVSLDGTAVQWAQRSLDGIEDVLEAKAFSQFEGACSEIVVEYPYIIGLQERSVEIKYLETTMSVQKLSFGDKFRVMKCGPFKKVLLGTASSIYMITMKSIDAQVDEFIMLSYFREAVDLFKYALKEVALGDDPENDAKLNSVYLRSFEALLRASRFSEGFDYFSMSHASPTVLLSWFPDLCPAAAAPKGGWQKGSVHSKGEATNGGSVRAIIAAKLSKAEDSPEVAAEYDSVEAQLKDTLRAYKKQYDEDIAEGLKSDAESVRAVNTALLLLYTKARSDALDAFVAARPAVDFALCKERLTEAKCWNALGLLYCAEGLEEDALRTWREMNGSVTSAVELLIRTEDARLVWEYAPWVLAKNPTMAMRIFVPSGVSPASAALKGVDTAEVVAFLEARTKEGTRAYLEYLVSGAGAAEGRDVYYEKLAAIYVDQSLEALEAPRVEAETGAAERRKALLRACRALKALLESKSEHAAAAARTVLARYDERFGRDIPMGAHREISVVKAAAYEKLGRPEDVLRVMIWEIGCQHRAENYCLENRSPEETSHLLCALARACFEYDMRACRKEAGSGAAEAEAEGDLTAAFSRRALGLLCLYGARISPLEVLEAIPGATPIASLLPYFKSSLKQFSHNKCESEVKRSLSKVSQLNEKCELVEIESDSFIRITDRTVCSQCNKLIGNSVFVKMPPPDDNVICFKCYDEKRKEKNGQRK